MRLLFILLLPLLLLGCNPSRGLVTIDTAPQGAMLYVNEAPIGETPATFEFDMEKPVTLKLLKEGYEPKTEKITAAWVKAQYQLGNYSKGKYKIAGEEQRAWEIRTLRELIRSESK
jgi:hypothetical protein